MNIMLNLHQSDTQKSTSKITSIQEDPQKKREEETATKPKQSSQDQNQNIRIRTEIFSMFRHDQLKGKIKVKDIQTLSEVNIILYHKIKKYNVQQNLKINFSSRYPQKAPELTLSNQYSIPNFLSHSDLLSKDKYTNETQIADVIAEVMKNLTDFHQSQIERVFTKSQTKIEQQQCLYRKTQENSIEKEMNKQPKPRRKSSNMTGCADKQLTQTKNLNRHFRSKLRQVLRDAVPVAHEDQIEYSQIDKIFAPNRVGFEDIRKALSNAWFNKIVKKQMKCGQFLHKILRGMMGIKSKKLMIKYYHVMASAVEDPNNFTRWKYD